MPKESISIYTDLVVLPTDSVHHFNSLNLDTVNTVNHNCSHGDEELPAYISKGPEDCTALVGGNVTLNVTYGGFSQPKVKWLLAVSQITLL